SSRKWPASGRQRVLPSEATTSSPSDWIEMLVRGTPDASCSRSEAHARRMRRMGTPDSTRPLVVLSRIRSWKPKERGPIGPRCGARKPARASARSRASGTSRMRAASRRENRCVSCGSARPISGCALIGLPSVAAVSAFAALNLPLAWRGLGLLARARGRLLLERHRLGAARGRRFCALARPTLAQALLQRVHEVDDLGALRLRGEGRDFLALDLGLDGLEHAHAVFVFVLLGLERVA